MEEIFLTFSVILVSFKGLPKSRNLWQVAEVMLGAKLIISSNLLPREFQRSFHVGVRFSQNIKKQFKPILSGTGEYFVVSNYTQECHEIEK